MAVIAPRLPSYRPPNDPTAGIYSLLLNNPSTAEVDTNAAEAALAGGFAGSQFAGNNTARMRDSERIAREVQGQQLLQPYLQRASQEGMAANEIAARQKLAEQQNQFELGKIGAQTQAQRDLAELEQKGALERVGAETAGRTAIEQLQQGGEMARQKEQIGAQQSNLQQQLAADAARQAIEQSGLKTRLDAEGQQRLQLALISGDQQAASDLLREAGATSRQREEIGSRLQIANVNARNDLIKTILPFALGGNRNGGATNDQGGHRVGGPFIGTPYESNFDWTTQTFTAAPSSPRTTAASGSPGSSLGNGNILSRVDDVLRRYGLNS